MPRDPRRRRLTRRQRRQAVRRTDYMLRSRGLNSRRQWQTHVNQQLRARAMIHFQETMQWLFSLGVAYALNALTGTTNMSLLAGLLVGTSLLGWYADEADFYTIRDSVLVDIPDNEDRATHWGPPRNRRIDDFPSDGNAKALTRFTKEELRELLHLFEFPEFVRVPCGPFGLTHYEFHREELLLFSLTKIAKGIATVDLCHMHFGGPPDRWSYGYPYFLQYIDRRYYRLHTTEGLRRWVHFFPAFANAVEAHIGRDAARINPQTREPYVVLGVTFHPPNFFMIFGFLDASLKETCTPETGPEGDFENAPRKNLSNEMQRALYTGWKKQHGLKIQTVLLPNGLSFVDGPYSMRQADTTLLELSNLNAFLFQLMLGFFGFVVYAVYGDRAYHNLECVRSPHAARPGANRGANLNPRERAEDLRMRMARISIEHYYGLMGRTFSICTVWSQHKLREESPYALEQVRVCHLLTNCYTVCNGSIVANTFRCEHLLPQTLAEYLQP